VNPITLVVWVLADNVTEVVLFVLAMLAVVITLAIHEGRHPFT
jgi:hypothetical protein